MGRGMVILAIGALIVHGLVKSNMFDQRQRIQDLPIGYAEQMQAKNTAHTAIQLAMEQINNDKNWHPTSGNPWGITVDSSWVEVYYDQLATGSTSLEPDTIRMYSNSWFGGLGNTGSSQYKSTATEHTVISTYTKTLMHFVPEARGGLGFGTSNFNFSMGGSSVVNGNDASGTCPDLPAVAVPEAPGQANEAKIFGGTSKTENLISSVDKVVEDPDMSYQPVDQLIARLSQQPGVKQISGTYKGDFGTPDDPGIFFVESYAKLTGGIPEGYGILVIRSGGELEYEGALSVAGNFTFNGLIVFENAFDFDGNGTPDLNGAVLVGNTPNNNTTIDVDLSGSLTIQYDCQALDYARQASADHLGQNRYTRITTFE